MSLEKSFSELNNKLNLLNNTDRVLLACSGGIDSMCLCHVFINLNITFGIAHIDHNTRKGESLSDANFVQEFAIKHKIPFHIKKIKETDFGNSKENNFQAFARDVRYSFFQEILDNSEFTKIATAHHLDDSIETVLINLTRGTGLSGMTGIHNKKDIIRPFLETSKEEIVLYAKSNKIEYCVDSSNQEIVYTRNFIRNKVLPLLLENNPNAFKGIRNSMKNLNETKEFINSKIIEWELKFVAKKSNYLKISTDSYSINSFLFFHFLKEYGFNRNQVDEILKVSQKGKKWFSNQFTIIFEGAFLILIESQLFDQKSEVHRINEEIPNLGVLQLGSQQELSTFQDYIILPTNIKIDSVIIRTWREADKIQTKIGKKKVNKYFNELKLDSYQKKQVLLVANGSDVLWIIGHLKAYIENPSKKALGIIT